jgi:hypothetical protein
VFWYGNLKGGDHFEDQVVHGRIILKENSKQQDGRVWGGVVSVRIGKSGLSLVNEVIKLRIPENEGHFLTLLETVPSGGLYVLEL